jgi:glutathione S-transferase
MKLHYSPTSPYARKVLMCAVELGMRDRIELVPVSVSPTAPNAMVAAHNPLMKVPTLEREGGAPLFDSAVICEYLDVLGRGALFPREGERRWEALRLQALADGVMDAALLLRYETFARPEPLRWSEWIAGQRLKIAQALDHLDVQRRDPGQPLHIGDITIACALGYLDLRFADDKWRDRCANLARWFDAISKRESFRSTSPA